MRLFTLPFLLLCVVTSSTALAKDDRISIVGFGRDGSLAFYTWGVATGSGLPHAEFNVCKPAQKPGAPKPAKKVELKTEGATDHDAITKVRADTEKTLKSMKLEEGQDLFTDDKGVTNAQFKWKDQELTLVLDSKDKGTDKKTGLPVQEGTLTLNGPGGPKKLTTVTGFSGYEFVTLRASSNGKSVMAIVRYDTKGHEGNEKRFMCVPLKL